MTNYKSFSNDELLHKTENLTNLARGLAHLLQDPTTDDTLGLPAWAQRVITQELLETRSLLSELQHRGYGTDVKL